MSNVSYFPIAERRQAIKKEEESRKDLHDYLFDLCEMNHNPQRDGLYPTSQLVSLCKFLMESAANAYEKGDISSYNHFDDLAWEVRQMDENVTNILYAEGFLQKHGII